MVIMVTKVIIVVINIFTTVSTLSPFLAAVQLLLCVNSSTCVSGFGPIFPTHHRPPAAGHLALTSSKSILLNRSFDPEEARSQRYKHLVDVMQVAQMCNASPPAAAVALRMVIMMRIVAETADDHSGDGKVCVNRIGPREVH